ncbi:hypothetical protein C8F01DRAFT_1144333 [Mycena amicta]|nr:hypothetical protein C8F01DRAFT_1144333 [Mycena amicta]
MKEKPYTFRPRTSSSGCKTKAERMTPTKTPTTGGDIRCQLARPQRAKARFLYHECDLNYSDIARVLKSTEAVVFGAVRNTYKVPDNEAHDWKYVEEEFKRLYLRYKDQDVVSQTPEPETPKLRFSESPLSEYDYGESRASSPTATHDPDADEPAFETHLSSPPAPIQLESQPSLSPEPPDLLDDFLEHGVSRHLSLAPYRDLFRLVGIGMEEVYAMAEWMRGEVAETLRRLLAVGEEHQAGEPQAVNGLTPFQLIALENAIFDLEIPVEPRQDDRKTGQTEADLQSFLAHPMPGSLSLNRYYNLSLSKGICSVEDLRAISDWDDERVFDVVRRLYEGEMDPFELLLVEMGVRRLRK